MMDDFKDHPVSLGEVKSDKSKNGKDWTPRDALIRALRDIDSGEFKPQSIFIAMTEEPTTEGVTHQNYFAAGPSLLQIAGTIQICSHAYMSDGWHGQIPD